MIMTMIIITIVSQQNFKPLIRINFFKDPFYSNLFHRNYHSLIIILFHQKQFYALFKKFGPILIIKNPNYTSNLYAIDEPKFKFIINEPIILAFFYNHII